MKNFLLVSVLAFCSVIAQVHAEIYPVVRATNPYPGSRYYIPNDSLKHPAVLMLHGSEGGSQGTVDIEASTLASLGYNVLAYCYFDCKRGIVDPRETLKNVELTKVLEAVAWLRANSSGKVVVYGISRGAELTMIVGSLELTAANRPDGLIAHAPADIFAPPYNWSWQSSACWLCKEGIGGCKGPFDPTNYQWNPSCGPDDPNTFDFSKSAWLLNGVSVSTEKRIEIEKYDGPILITVGLKDEVWPSDMTKRIETTLLTAGRHPEIHYWPDQGHGFVGKALTERRNFVVDFLSRFTKSK